MYYNLKQKYNNGGKKTKWLVCEYVQKKFWWVTADAEGEINFSFLLKGMRVDGKLTWITLGVVKLKLIGVVEADFQRFDASPDSSACPQHCG